MPTPSDAAIVREMFLAGNSFEQIVTQFERMGRPRTYLQCVYNCAKRKLPLDGRVNRERPWTPDEDEILTRRWGNGTTIELLRKSMYRTPEAVKTRLVELKLPGFDREEKSLEQNRLMTDLLSKPWGEATQRGRENHGAPYR
jgi:hypothetical protein